MLLCLVLPELYSSEIGSLSLSWNAVSALSTGAAAYACSSRFSAQLCTPLLPLPPSDYAIGLRNISSVSYHFILAIALSNSHRLNRLTNAEVASDQRYEYSSTFSRQRRLSMESRAFLMQHLTTNEHPSQVPHCNRAYLLCPSLWGISLRYLTISNVGKVSFVKTYQLDLGFEIDFIACYFIQTRNGEQL